MDTDLERKHSLGESVKIRPPSRSLAKDGVHLWRKSFGHLAVELGALLLLSSCANHHFRVASPAEGPEADAPRAVELLAEKQIATLHFPPGEYSFYAVDDVGYYYRAPTKIKEHTGGGSIFRNGGIYLSKKNPGKMRGYVYLSGALTHVGDLSRVPHEFRN